MKDAKSKAIRRKNKEAGHKIASVIADQRAYEKRHPEGSYSYPFHQVKALEKKYPEQTKRYGEKVGPKGKYFR